MGGRLSSDQFGDLGLDLLIGFRQLRCSLVEQGLAPRFGYGPCVCSKIRQALG
jgi:hypothetical protein